MQAHNSPCVTVSPTFLVTSYCPDIVSYIIILYNENSNLVGLLKANISVPIRFSWTSDINHGSKVRGESIESFNLNLIIQKFLVSRAEPTVWLFCLFLPIFFPAILFFLPIFAQYFAHYLTIFLLIKGFSWCISKFWARMTACCIRVIHNMVTALLEYLDLLAVFPEAYYVNLILFVTILIEYFHLCNAK